MHIATVFQQPFGQHDHCIRHRRRCLAIVQMFISIQYENTLLVGINDLLSEISALDRGGQVNLTGGQPSQHDSRYAEVYGVTDVTVGEVHRTTAVQDEHLTLITGRKFGGQPVATDANVGQQGRVVFGRHFDDRWGRQVWSRRRSRKKYLKRETAAGGLPTSGVVVTYEIFFWT